MRSIAFFSFPHQRLPPLPVMRSATSYSRSHGRSGRRFDSPSRGPSRNHPASSIHRVPDPSSRPLQRTLSHASLPLYSSLFNPLLPMGPKFRPGPFVPSVLDQHNETAHVLHQSRDLTSCALDYSVDHARNCLGCVERRLRSVRFLKFLTPKKGTPLWLHRPCLSQLKYIMHS